MTLFIRDKENRSIVDLELYVKKEDGRKFVELDSAIILDRYSKFLLENLDRADEIIDTFNQISELRGWLWESYFMDTDNTENEYPNVVEEVSKMMKTIAKKFNLYFVID